MKRLGLLCVTLALLLAACGGETAPSPGMPETAVPRREETANDVTPVPAPTEDHAGRSEAPELLFLTHSVYDPETEIQRTTLDAQGMNLQVFLEIPIFEETGEGYQNINQFFADLNADFFSEKEESLMAAWYEYAPWTIGEMEGDPYYYRRSVAVDTSVEHLVSVSILYEWWMGGVLDYGSDNYTFRTDTGELLGLLDVADGTEEELKKMVMDGLAERNEFNPGIELEGMEKRSLDQFEFSIREGSIWINFDKYEAAHGAYGSFSVELPAKLREV